MSAEHRRRPSLMIAVVLTGALAACSPTIQLAGQEPTPLRFYELTAPSPKRSSALPPGAGPSLEVVRPLAAPSLDRTHIAVRPEPRELRYLADARWADRLATLVHDVLVEAFERDGRVRVLREDFAGLSSAVLQVEIREFHADTIDAAAPLARVELHAQLVAPVAGEIADARLFQATRPIDASDAGAVVAALDAALGSVTEAMVEWAVESLPKGEPGSASPRAAPRRRARSDARTSCHG